MPSFAFTHCGSTAENRSFEEAEGDPRLGSATSHPWVDSQWGNAKGGAFAFLRRLALSVVLASVVILGSLAIGVLGYRPFEGLS